MLHKRSAISNIAQASEVADKTEFVARMEMALKSAKIMNMSELQAAYRTILQEDHVQGMTYS